MQIQSLPQIQALIKGVFDHFRLRYQGLVRKRPRLSRVVAHVTVGKVARGRECGRQAATALHDIVYQASLRRASLWLLIHRQTAVDEPA